jgi:transglutaminase-like putative cysteine protease
VRYDPYVPFYKPEHYRPSQILDLGRGYCVVKAVVLCAVGRAAGIASRLGFCDIRNHGAPPEVIQVLGSDIFTWHGYTEFLLDGRWLKATPAFDRAVCQRHNIDPLTFEGTADAVFPPTDLAGSPYVEYIAHHGSFTDLPLDRLLADWNRIYGKDRVDAWIAAFEQDGATSFKGERGLTV